MTSLGGMTRQYRTDGAVGVYRTSSHSTLAVTCVSGLSISQWSPVAAASASLLNIPPIIPPAAPIIVLLLLLPPPAPSSGRGVYMELPADPATPGSCPTTPTPGSAAPGSPSDSWMESMEALRPRTNIPPRTAAAALPALESRERVPVPAALLLARLVFIAREASWASRWAS